MVEDVDTVGVRVGNGHLGAPTGSFEQGTRRVVNDGLLL